MGLRLADHLDSLDDIEICHFGGNPRVSRINAIDRVCERVRILARIRWGIECDLHASYYREACIMGTLGGYKLRVAVMGKAFGRNYKYGPKQFELDVKGSYADILKEFERQCKSS